jgi:hypothetical protein
MEPMSRGSISTNMVVFIWVLVSIAGRIAARLAGRRYDYAAGEGGDALDLVAQIYCNGDKRAVMDWAREWLRLPQRQVERAPQQRHALQRDNLRELRERRDGALRVWLAAKPVERGDHVRRYLEGRGIDLKLLTRVPQGAELPSEAVERGIAAPLAGDGGADRRMYGRNCAVHPTWLEERNLACEDGPRVGKPLLVDPKLRLGKFRGGYIRLWRGAEGRSWSSIKPAETLLVAERIEDLLNYVQFQPQWRAACAVSLSFMVAMELPPEFTEIRTLAQRDLGMTADGKTVQLSPARKLLHKVLARFEGRRAQSLSLDAASLCQRCERVHQTSYSNRWGKR